VAAINCASEENFPVCTSFDIKGFPTVKFFPAFSVAGQKGLEMKPGSKHEKDYKPKMVDYIEMHLGAQRPSHWPVFRQLDSRTSYESLPSHFADLSNNYPSLKKDDRGDVEGGGGGGGAKKLVDVGSRRSQSRHDRVVVLVFHLSSAPYEPKFVTLHLSSDPRLVVFGVDVDAFRKAGNRDFLAKFELRELDLGRASVAYLLIFPHPSPEDGGGKVAAAAAPPALFSLLEVNASNDALALQKRVKELVPWTTVGLTFVPPDRQSHFSSADGKASLGASLPAPAPKGVFMTDLVKAIRYALIGEVGMRNVIDAGPDLDAVDSFVGVLAKYFPGDDASARFLRQINGWLQSRGNVSIAGREWRRRINAANAAFGGRGVDAAAPDAAAAEGVDAKSVSTTTGGAQEWVGCRGSRPTTRGYPCALWTLFHVLSVAAADANAGADEEKVDGREVIDAMAKYVKSFFGCRECASHFDTMVNEDLDDSVQSYDDVILWLWKAHNKVNQRLKGASSEDPQAPKIQFPDIPTCLSCRIEGNQAAWHYVHVKQFLKNYYRNISVVGGRGRGEGGRRGAAGKGAPKKGLGIESIEASVVKPRYHPGEIAKIKKEHRDKKLKNAKVGGDHVDVEKLRQREKETRRRVRPPAAGAEKGILGFTDWDVRICFGAYGFCAVVLVALYIAYIDRRCRHRFIGVNRRWRSCDDAKAPLC